MLLYNTIQDFKKQLELLKSDNTHTYEYAKTELLKTLESRVEESENNIVENLKNDLSASESLITLNVKNYAHELFTQKSDEIVQKCAQSIDLQALQDVCVQKVLEHNEPILAKSFKGFLDENAQDLSASHRNELREIITQKVRETINANAQSITQEVIKGLDFSFLSNQPQVFYEVIINSMGELLTKKCEQEYLENYFKEMGRTIYDEIKDLEKLQEIEFSALIHLNIMHAQNEIKSLSDALSLVSDFELKEQDLKNQMQLLEKQNTLEQQKLNNAIALEQKRQEMIQNGQLPNKEQINVNAYKVG